MPRVIPLRSACVELFWIVGPSAIGSEKGIPTSIMSMPPSLRARMMSGAESRVGNPAVKYTDRISELFLPKRRWSRLIFIVCAEFGGETDKSVEVFYSG